MQAIKFTCPDGTEVPKDIFGTIANQQVNIRACAQFCRVDRLMDMIITPGHSEGVPFPGIQTERDISVITTKLSELGIGYSVDKVTVVNNVPCIQGMLGKMIHSLAEHNLTISHADESGYCIIDSPDIDKIRAIAATWC